MSATSASPLSSLNASMGYTSSTGDATLFRSQTDETSFSQMLQNRIQERPVAPMGTPAPIVAKAPRSVEKPQDKAVTKTAQESNSPKTEAQKTESSRPENSTNQPDKASASSKENEQKDTTTASDAPSKDEPSSGNTLSTVDSESKSINTDFAASALPNNPALLQAAAENTPVSSDLPAAIAALFSHITSGTTKQHPVLSEKSSVLPDGSSSNTVSTSLLTTESFTENNQPPALLLPRSLNSGEEPTTKATSFATDDTTTSQFTAPTPLTVDRLATTPLASTNPDESISTINSSHLQHLSALSGARISTPSAQAAPPQLPLTTTAGQSGWAEEVGNRVIWMLGRAESKAELVLTPPNLGKVEVSINLNGDQTTAHFIASSQAARDALEQALPRLRDILQQSGIALGQTHVGTSDQQQASTDSRSSSGQQHHGHPSGEEQSSSPQSVQPAVWIKQSQGMVDTFV